MKQILRFIALLIICTSLLYAKTYKFIVQPDEHIEFVRVLTKKALKAAGVDAEFVYAPKCNERRKLYMLKNGVSHMDFMPATPDRIKHFENGEIWHIPVPFDRGLLGYRLNLLIESRKDILKEVDSVEKLRNFTIGQGEGWMDVMLYRNVGVPTKEVRYWRDAEFVRQMKTGFIDIFPLGLEESLSYFIPHFQQFYPELTYDEHILLRYPWFRFVWVSPKAENAQMLYDALKRGFDIIIESGEYMKTWEELRQAPDEKYFKGRTIIDIENPYYGYDLVPEKYRKLLFSRRKQ